MEWNNDWSLQALNSMISLLLKGFKTLLLLTERACQSELCLPEKYNPIFPDNLVSARDTGNCFGWTRCLDGHTVFSLAGSSLKF